MFFCLCITRGHVSESRRSTRGSSLSVCHVGPVQGGPTQLSIKGCHIPVCSNILFLLCVLYPVYRLIFWKRLHWVGFNCYKIYAFPPVYVALHNSSFYVPSCMLFSYCPIQSQILCSKYPNNTCTQFLLSSLHKDLLPLEKLHSDTICWSLFSSLTCLMFKIFVTSPLLWEALQVTESTSLHMLRDDKYCLNFDSFLILHFSFTLSLHHTRCHKIAIPHNSQVCNKLLFMEALWPPEILASLVSCFRLSWILTISMKAQTAMPLSLSLFLFCVSGPLAQDSLDSNT